MNKQAASKEQNQVLIDRIKENFFKAFDESEANNIYFFMNIS